MGVHQKMTGAERVAKRRAALRAKGFKLKQFWVPDVNAPQMLADIQRGVAAINRSGDGAEIMEWLDANYDEVMAGEPDYDWGPDGPPQSPSDGPHTGA
jgi:Protein  of unknown function (DUF3018)